MQQQYVNIRLVEADESLKDLSYDISKAAYYDLIERTFGWKEEKHREYHERYWKEQRPSIIFLSDRPIGTVRVVDDGDAMEISQFCILPEYHNQGIGTSILRGLLERADTANHKVCLMCIKANPARALYERHGFETVSSDDEFFHMEREPNPLPR